VALAVLAGATLTGCGSDKPSSFKPGTAKFRSGASSGTGGVKVTSTAFPPDGHIPVKFTCKGDGAFPPITWSGVPAGSIQVAFMVTDPDAPKGTFVHWLVVGLPAKENGRIDSGAAPPPAHSEPNSAGKAAWTPPCPPAGSTHHYVFEVIALKQRVNFKSGQSPIDKVRALRAAAKAGGLLNASFKAP
jgi:Raf kinase inhibitor-like YbhB/YbcL family protein